ARQAPFIERREDTMRWDTRGLQADNQATTTAIGRERGGGGTRDLYEPGTQAQRAYLRSIAESSLALTVKFDKLEELGKDDGNGDDNDEFIDIEDALAQGM
ncbi:MAG: hypothetical protein Q9223_007878, partial [Gallowayella weberi]